MSRVVLGLSSATSQLSALSVAQAAPAFSVLLLRVPGESLQVSFPRGLTGGHLVFPGRVDVRPLPGLFIPVLLLSFQSFPSFGTLCSLLSQRPPPAAQKQTGGGQMNQLDTCGLNGPHSSSLSSHSASKFTQPLTQVRSHERESGGHGRHGF